MLLQKMKKFTKVAVKLSLLVWVAILGIYFGEVMVFAQFGGVGETAKWVGGLNVGDVWTWTSLMDIIKGFINWMLGLLSLIALVVCLYGGFNMVTAAGDEAKYKKGFKILQQAAVGLVIIGLSWIIVSFIFSIVWSASNTWTITTN